MYNCTSKGILLVHKTYRAIDIVSLILDYSYFVIEYMKDRSFIVKWMKTIESYSKPLFLVLEKNHFILP